MRQPENESVNQPRDPSRGCPTKVERKRASPSAKAEGNRTGGDVPTPSAVPAQAPKYAADASIEQLNLSR